MDEDEEDDGRLVEGVATDSNRSCHCPVMVTVTGALAYRPGPARVSATASGPR